jgi:hypothetical protein
MGQAGHETQHVREEMTRFLTDLINRHDVSTEYIDSLVPAVEAIFDDIPRDIRGRLLLLVEESVIRQSQTEAIMGQASALLDNLREVNKTLAPSRPAQRSRRRAPVKGKTYCPSLADQFMRRSAG